MDRYEALQHAVKAHGATLDKCGKLYVLHPMAVAETCEAMETSTVLTLDEDVYVVALLHDVLEDTDYELDSDWFSTWEWDALDRVTRRTTETYWEYIEKITASPTATIVKLADLWHNLQPLRQGCLPENEARSLGRRYLKARQRLWDALGNEWWPA
jgi:(p)ppGpp synthase/HD superfamily hydrolase